MKAKFLSVLLALTMVLSLLPTAALAEDKTVSTEEELKQAIESVSDGDTITVSGTIEVNAPLVVKNTVTLTGGSIVASDTFSSTSGDFTKYNLISLQTPEKTLTLKDIILDAKGKTLVVYCNAGKVVVDGATITGGKTSSYVAGVYMTSASQFEMNSGSITGNEVGDSFKNNHYTQYASDLWIGANANGALTSINGGKIGNIFVNSNEWSEKNPGSFTMSGGSVDNIYVEYDKGHGATFTYSNGTIDHLYLSTIKGNGGCIEVTPVAGTSYKGGVPENPVAQVGSSYYDTVESAIAANKTGTVVLLNDTIESVTIPADANLTLDLNGHKIVDSATAQDETVAEASRKHTITNNGTLTILDSVGGGIVDNVSHGRAAIYNAGTITEIKSGKFTRSVDASIDASSANGNSWYVVYNDTNATISKISGGEFLAVGKFSSLFCNSGSIGEISGGTFTQDGFIAFKNEGTIDKISGGTFSSADESCIQNWGSIGEITDGTITAGRLGIWNFSSDKYTSAGTIGKISGGNISGSTAAIRLNDYDTSYLTPSKPSTTNKASASITGGNISGALQVNTNTTLTITGGYFTVDPSAYVDDNHYVVESDETDYTYMVTNEKPDEVPVIVTDEVAVSIDKSIKGTDANAIEAVIGRAAVENVSDALTDDAQDKLIADAGVKASELDESDTVTIVVNVAVKAVASDLSNTNNATLTFEADPTATVYVNGEKKGEAQDVSNDMLNGSITVKLPLPEGFTPKQIAHKSDGYRTEYYLDHYERGAKHFTIDENNCAVFDITHFSTFVLSSTQTYVAPSRPSSSTGSTITVGKTENGTITVSPATASKGTNVTITAKPADGYELGSLTATDANGSTLALTDLGNGKYSFTMPDGKVEVNGTFVKKSAQTFVDVPENAYYTPAVNWAVEKGVTEGTSATTFSPDAACTRAQIVTFLYRAAGSPAVKSTVNPFTDVTASDYYYNAVLWAVENGITTGTSETTFSPNESCTRAQCVTFLYRAVGSAATAKASFTDVSADAYYAPAVDWAVEKGVTTGTSATTFSPDDACTRAQIVTFLYRAAQVK